MEKKSILLLVLTFVLGIYGLWAVTPVYVDDNFNSSTEDWGVTRFATIANGIAAVDPGGTVYVAAGNYVTCGISKSVTLLGANAGIHPVVGTHTTEVVGARGPESIWNGCVPSANNITIDGFHFLKAGTRMIDTYATANNFTLRNCIVESTLAGATTGVMQFGGGNHTNSIFEFNWFKDKGDHTFYAGISGGLGDFDGLIFRYNKFNAEGDAIFWAAESLDNAIIQGNEFDGEAGTNFNTVNIGLGGNIQIVDNWVHDCLYTAFQVGIIGGSIINNIIERTYTYGSYGAKAFELWGGQYNTAVSSNVLISQNTIRYNDITGVSYPAHGFRLRLPDTGSGIVGSTIHFENNSFINGGVLSNAYALWFQGDQSTAVDADYNYWGATNPNFAQTISGNVDYDPWWANIGMTEMESNNYLAGHSYSFTVNSPNSNNGTQVKIWGFYTNTSNAWVSATYGTATFNGGTATINYTIPADYFTSLYWEIRAFQAQNSQTQTILYNPDGPWGQFDTYMLNGQTINMETYRFDNFELDFDSAQYTIVGGTSNHPTTAVNATVEVLIPWTGSINDYNNALYNNEALYRKIGLYPTYAANLGYTVQVMASNPSEPNFQQIRISKPSIGYDVILFGARTATTEDLTGYMWWTTFPNLPASTMTMTYNPTNGTCIGTFDTPLSYNTQYFIQPHAKVAIDGSTRYYEYRPGSMDLILGGGMIPAPVNNTTRHIGYGTIQAAIDDANPDGGDVITVKAGTYPENLVIDKRVDLRGPNYGITPNGIARVAEAVIVPASSDPDPYSANAVTIMYLESGSSGSSISGFTIDGDNTSLTSGIDMRGADVDACEAIAGFDGLSNINVSKNIIKNVNYAGIDFYNYNNTGAPTTGNMIDDNMFENIIPPAYGIAILLYNNCYTSVTNNHMSYVRIGIQTGNFYHTDPGNSRTISGNVISSSRLGIFHNLAYSNASEFYITNNAFNHAAYGTASGWVGVLFSSMAVASSAANNTINGIGATIPTTGYMAWNTQPAPLISGGTVSNVDTGINVNNYEGYSSNGDRNTFATISDVDFVLNAGGKGIYVHDNALNTNNLTVQLTLGADVTVAGGAKGVVVDGSDATLTSPLSNLALTNQTEFYFELLENNKNINATAVTFNGDLAADMTNAQLAALEAKVWHKLDDYDLGLITVNYTDLYVQVPDLLIKDNETQVYSVVTNYVQNLRTFKVKFMVPKADFNAPAYQNAPIAFALGAAYDGYPFAQLLPILFDDTDQYYYSYEVTGGFFGSQQGITGTNMELLKVTLTSLTNRDNIPVGCLVKLPVADVLLRNPRNDTIACRTSTDGFVLIDSSEPTMEHNNAGTYPSGMTLSVESNGSGLLVRPILNLTFRDNYNLGFTKYLLQETPSVPDDPTDFTTDLHAVDGLDTTFDWQLPAEVNTYAEGTYTVYFLVVDDATNFNIYSWTFTIDKTAPGAVSWVLCRTTPNGNISVDLEWTNANDPARIHIWALDYDVTMSEANGYPLYNATNLNPTITNDINRYSNGPSTLGWVKVADIPVASSLTLNTTTWELNQPMLRGYYYFTIYAVDAYGNISTAPASPFYRESISYWPGDVSDVPDPVHPLEKVVSNDVSLLSGNWGLTTATGMNAIIDVGPSIDYGRRSRPMPDGKINIEDMMMFAMNYYNTNYTVYTRDDDMLEYDPIRIDLAYSAVGDQLTIGIDLSDNADCVKGLSIPLHYGAGLSLLSVTAGDFLPSENLLLYSDQENVVDVSVSVLGCDAVITGNGRIATLVFAIGSGDVSTELMHMTARDIDNRNIEIVDNPEGSPTDIPEDVVEIPQTSFLSANYPNPFNPSTTMRYGLKEAGNVRIYIYNSRGQLVCTLVNDAKAAGSYEVTWNGKDNNNQPVSSGMYLVRMETKEHTQTRKVLLLK